MSYKFKKYLLIFLALFALGVSMIPNFIGIPVTVGLMIAIVALLAYGVGNDLEVLTLYPKIVMLSKIWAQAI